jgi:hypothetical protein
MRAPEVGSKTEMATVKEHRGCRRRSIDAELTLCCSLAVFSTRSGRCFTDEMVVKGLAWRLSCGHPRLLDLSPYLQAMFSLFPTTQHYGFRCGSTP